MKLTKIIKQEYEDISSKEEVPSKNYTLDEKLKKELLTVLDLADSFAKRHPMNFAGRETVYNFMYVLLERISFSKEDCTEFASHLSSIKDIDHFSLHGQFISTMMNVHFEKTKQQEEYIFRFPEEKKMDYFCYNLEGQNVRIFGNLGSFTCEKMQAGNVTIFGDIGDHCGGLWNGTMTVHGNAGITLGNAMKDGTITIFGDTKRCIGYQMRGGNIFIKGKAGNLIGHGMESGRIYLDESLDPNNTDAIDHRTIGQRAEIYVKGNKVS